MVWEDAMRQSDADFNALVWPNIAGRSGVPNGELLSVQMDGLTSTSSRTLDTLGGIDYLVVQQDSTITTMAARVSYVSDPFASFTVGFEEFDQKQRAIEAGSVVAEYTCHAYVSRAGDPQFLGAVITQTRALFEFADQFPGCVTTQRNTYTGDPFKVVWGQCMADEGFNVRMYLADGCERIVTKTGAESVPVTLCDDCAATRDEEPG
jgi:hypothetical protein